MMRISTLLLASHGTEGAKAAEKMAMSLCDQGGRIHQLIVVPDLWKGMMGDDWLNNGITRDRFGRYLENELGREVDENLERVQNYAQAAGFSYSWKVVNGEPDQCLLHECAKGIHYDLVVMGSPRPKGTPGLRSRMATDLLVQSLRTPLLIVPFPDAG